MKWVPIDKAKGVQIMEPVLVKDAKENWTVARLEKVEQTKEGFTRTWDCIGFDGARKITDVTHVCIPK